MELHTTQATYYENLPDSNAKDAKPTSHFDGLIVIQNIRTMDRVLIKTVHWDFTILQPKCKVYFQTAVLHPNTASVTQQSQ
jgi:hypothetical protein